MLSEHLNTHVQRGWKTQHKHTNTCVCIQHTHSLVCMAQPSSAFGQRCLVRSGICGLKAPKFPSAEGKPATPQYQEDVESLRWVSILVALQTSSKLNVTMTWGNGRWGLIHPWCLEHNILRAWKQNGLRGLAAQGS